MKKVLFATTALVASTSFAAAEVSLSGGAEMGVVGGSGIETQFHHDLDVVFTMSGETDNGLTFGATIDLDEVGDDCSVITTGGGSPVTVLGSSICSGGDGIASGFGEHSVFISGDFGTLTMGDTDGAFDWAYGEVNVVGGTIDDSETSHAGFFDGTGLDGGNDGQVLRYDYSFGDFAFAVSVELDDAVVADDIYGLGLTYGADFGGIAMSFGLGYQTNGNLGNDIVGLTVGADFGNGFQAALGYVDFDGFSSLDSHWGIGLGYTMDALSIGVNYGEYESTTGATTDGFGLAVGYDLGGGASILFGYGDSGAPASSTWSLGVAMSF